MASTKIRGITIEIGADTTGLNKALGDVNKQIGSTQKQLKDVDKLLKLDPKNTELLAQKQRMLKDAVDETKTKLEALKGAQEEVEQAYKNGDIDQGQYDAFQREIIACENELKNLEKQASEANVTLQKISANGESLKKVGSNISGVGDTLTKNVTTPIVGLGAAIVKTTADFDKQMSRVKAISGATGNEFDLLRDKAREMGKKTKYSATDAADAMEYMAMAGWKTEDMLDGIEGIMNLAAASGEDLANTSDIVTDALTAFGEGAGEAGRYADLLATVSSNANTNVEMMGETLKYAATPAATLGYSIEDVSLAMGLMANSGTKASTAGTALRNIFNRMAKPTKESAAAMDRLGISLDDGEGNMYSFREIMDQLRDSFGHINMPVEEFNDRVSELENSLDDGSITQKEYDKELEELIKQAYGAEKAEKARAAAMLAGQRGMTGLLGIVNASAEDYEKLTTAIDGSSGAAQNMADIMMDNTAGKTEILLSKLQELAISLGDMLIPIVDKFVEYLQDLTDKFNGLDDSTKETILKMLGIAAALGPVLSIFGRFLSVIGNIMTIAPKLGPVFNGIKIAIGALTSPIGLVVAAIVGLVALIAVKGDEIQAILKKVDDFLQNIFAKDFTKVLGPVLGNVLNGFMQVFKGTWDGLKKILDGLIDFIRGVFTGDWKRVWNGVKSIFEGIFGTLANVVKGPMNAVIAILNGAIGGINSLISKINSISIDVPKMLGGGKLGFNIPTLGKIPYLANGGTVFNGSAIVGEAGAELLNVNNGQATVTPLTGNNQNNAELTGLLENIYSAVLQGQTMYLDGNTLVGSTAGRMNDALGRIATRSVIR